MSTLFSKFHLADLTLDNRIVVPPMCQYSAVDGNATDWHLMHLGQMATSGAGLVIVEATAVSKEGRISPGDLGLYSDDNEAALGRVLQGVRAHGAAKLAIQLAHAGRKASSHAPWMGGQQIPPNEPDGWKAVAPSAVAHGAGEDEPLALDLDGMKAIQEAFVQAAKRAVRLGFDGIEVHMAHGYLLHEFLSPLSNTRTDAHGGTLENRMRYPLEVFQAVRDAVPPAIPVWVRVSATDWVDGGWTADETIVLAKALKKLGCAAIDVSTGGLSQKQVIKAEPNYQVPFAKRVKAETGMTTMAVGLITEPSQAEAIVAEGGADLVAIGRGMLFNPRWPWHAAAELGAQVQAPPQYWRSQPSKYKHLFAGAAIGAR